MTDPRLGESPARHQRHHAGEPREAPIKEALKALTDLVGGASIARCAMTELEYCFSAENVRQWDVRANDLAVYGAVAVEAADFTAALDLQRDLARVGLAKRKAPDLIIAAVAIRKGLTLVHYHADFDQIAKVSELKHQWIVPAGLVD
jgi:predicted nucleic acid-binding protein